MKNYKKIISLVLGSAFMLGAGTIIANAQEKIDEFSIDTNKPAYIKVSDENQNYFEAEEDFYQEMYEHCHGDDENTSNYRSDMMREYHNSNYKNNMMRNYDNTNSNYNEGFKNL